MKLAYIFIIIGILIELSIRNTFYGRMGLTKDGGRDWAHTMLTILFWPLLIIIILFKK